MKKQIKCSLVGARGYAGLELARLLKQHPEAHLAHCFATTASNGCLPQSEILNHKSDVVFLATPAEVSLELAPKLLEQGSRVIDLSGAFRLKTSDFQRWYGFEHTEPALLKEAVYGLAPFAGPSRGERLVANPGCYASAIEMALIPIAAMLEGPVVIDAKSGTTGAGKKANDATLFSEVDGECLPYKVGKHQHTPEIFEALASYANFDLDAHFTTSLLPVRRGIIAGIYARTNASEAEIASVYAKAFSDYPLAKVQLEGGLLLKRVVGTANTHITFSKEGEKLYLFSAIDNLLKGAASQAIENLNRLNDLPVETGLKHLEALT